MTSDLTSTARLDRAVALVAADAAPDRQAFLTAAVAALAEHRAELPFGAVPDPHDFDPADGVFARMACEHPEACGCDADYPDWTPGSTS